VPEKRKKLQRRPAEPGNSQVVLKSNAQLKALRGQPYLAGNPYGGLRKRRRGNFGWKRVEKKLPGGFRGPGTRATKKGRAPSKKNSPKATGRAEHVATRTDNPGSTKKLLTAIALGGDLATLGGDRQKSGPSQQENRGKELQS